MKIFETHGDNPFPTALHCEAKDLVMGRMFQMAPVRLLQFVREVDVITARQFIGGNSQCNTKLGAVFRWLQEEGAVTGQDSGKKDERGWPYKRWRLSDPEKAKTALKRRFIRPMRASAMGRWQARP